MAVPLIGISNLTIRDRLVRRDFNTSGFNSPFSAQCSIAGQSRLGNSARDLLLRCTWIPQRVSPGLPSLGMMANHFGNYWRALGSNEAKILQHHGGHPHWNKGVNIIQLEFDMSVFAFYIVVFADTLY